MITIVEIRDALKCLAVGMEACADELNTRDGALGDGDLGVTMIRGCRQILEVVDGLPDDVGMAAMKCAQAFTKTSGSSYGTLLATGLMAIAKQKKGSTSIDESELSGLLQVVLEAMIARGKASLGDKTLLDAVEAARQGISNTEEPLETAIASVKTALDEFRNRENKIGRARIFAEKSVGLDDPGMIAFLRILESLRTG
jgi:dihydroxyacetone kinase-like protein